jgi:hypothetical protein
MPFKSDAQRRFMYAQHPGVAKRWERHTPKGKKLPARKKEAAQDRRQAFKVGFLRRLAEEGLTPTEFHTHVKNAFDPVGSTLAGLGGAAEAGHHAVSTGLDVGKLLAQLGIVAPLGLGALSGIAQAKLTSPSVEDIEALRREELAAKYEQLTRRIRQRMSKREMA